MANSKWRLNPGDTFTHQIGHSEVACHMKVAGKMMKCQLLLDGRMVQLFDDNGRKFSAPITYGEAGVYKDQDGHYIY